MSHFTVLVIGKNIDEQLQPYHEYECTGIKDQYVQFVEADEDIEKKYAEMDTEEKKGYASIEEYAKDYYGYIIQDGKIGRITNPNSKWDWWVIGGRWTGFFKMKEGETGATGKPGLMTKAAKEGYADVAYKKDIDFDAMRNDAAEKAAKNYDLAMKIFGNLPVNTHWDKMRKDIPFGEIDVTKKAYWAQERCAAWKKAESKAGNKWPFGFYTSPDEFIVSREQYIQAAKDDAITTFAVVKDGQWHERGKMGWWGCVNDEKNTIEWQTEFNKLLDGLPDDEVLAIVDCHI